MKPCVQKTLRTRKKYYVRQIAAADYQKFTSWKTERKHVNQTVAI